MLRKEQNELLTQTGPATPMGRMFRAYWIPALLDEELPENDCPPVRVKLLAERLLAVPRQRRQVWTDRRILCPPRRVALVRPQRGIRPALRLSRLEIRRDGTMHRRSVRAARERLLPEDQAQVIPAGEARPGAVDLYGCTRTAAAAAGMGIRHRPGRSDLHLQAPAGVQLAASHGRRHRLQPRFLSAPWRPRLRSAVQGRQGQSIQPLRHAALFRGRGAARRALYRRPAQRRERQLLLADHALG